MSLSPKMRQKPPQTKPNTTGQGDQLQISMRSGNESKNLSEAVKE